MTTIILPFPPSECSPNARCHWSVKAKAAKAYRKECWALTLESGIKVDWDGPIYVSLAFLPPDRRRRDLDNCISSAKSALDGIADALGVNDSRFKLRAEISDDVAGKVWVTVSRAP